MNRVWVVVLVGACAKGGSSGESPDANEQRPDASIPGTDASETFVDAEPQEHDAPPPPDATVISPDAPPDACIPVATEKLANPALDLAPTGVGWTEVPLPNLPGGPFPIITSDPAGVPSDTAPNKAWFGGATAADASPPVATITDQLFQDITFPGDATSFVVSGMILIGTQEPGGAFDRFRIDVTETNGTQIEAVAAFDNTNAVSTFTPFSKTLSSNLAGRTVRLRLTSTHDDSFNTNFFVDSLSFRATFCP